MSNASFKEECGICYKSCKYLSRPDVCEHSFCYKCLLKWSDMKEVSTCPVCRRAYQEIITKVKPDTPESDKDDDDFNLEEEDSSLEDGSLQELSDVSDDGVHIENEFDSNNDDMMELEGEMSETMVIIRELRDLVRSMLDDYDAFKD
jgi:Uncharacterized conserved protein, contains RING Zn-finger